MLLLTSCGGGGAYHSAWNGRRGYDGNGDYGYDLAASRLEAHEYRAGASSHYPAPGSPDDPWGPYIREAAARYSVPEQWVRAVMHQESGGRQYASDGSLITSSAGAMGLMQVMPGTYDILRRQYGLGDDPFDPHNNILAGTAYIRDMYQKYGAPGFLAAYNAGPNRLDDYLAGNSALPDETVNYLARIAPNLGNQIAMTGPLAGFAGGGAYASATPAPASGADLAYAGGGLTGTQYYDPAAAAPTAASVQLASSLTPSASDPALDSGDSSDQAFDGGGLVTPGAPTGMLQRPIPAPITVAAAAPAPTYATPAYATPAYATPAYAAPSRQIYGSALGRRSTLAPPASPPPATLMQTAYRPQPAPVQIPPPRPIPQLVAVAAPGTPTSGWGIQIGAYSDPAISRIAVNTARSRAGSMLAGAQPAITPIQRNALLYRTRLVGLSADKATAACSVLVRSGLDCLTVPPGL
jgi:D-alanyl-D-alanine carboxypeptidase